MKFQSLQLKNAQPSFGRQRRKTWKALLASIASCFVIVGGQSALAQDSTQDTQQTTTTTSSTPSEHKTSAGGVFIEPILLGSSENFSMKTAQLPFVTSNTSGTTSGYGLGLRLGLHASQVIFLGIDGRYDHEQMKDSFYQTADADAYNYGPTLGLQMPYFGLRIFGTYVMGGEFNPAPGVDGLDLKFKDPRGWRVGAGLHIASVSLNLEYEDLNYATTVVESLGSLAANSNVNMQTETNGYLLSLSFPVEL